MSFRRRVVMLSAAAVAVAIVIASVVVYVVTSGELHGQIDASLRAKLIPGRPQSIQIKQVAVGPHARRQIERESRRMALGGGAPVPLTAKDRAELERIAARLRRSGGNATFRSLPLPHISTSGTLVAPVANAGHGEQLVIHRHISAHGRLAGIAAAPGPVGAFILGGHGGSAQAVSIVVPAPNLGADIGYAQLTLPGGKMLRSGGPHATLPITAADHAVAAGRRPAFFSDATVAGTAVRVLTAPAPGGGLWQVALPLTSLNSTLKGLLLLLALVSLGGVLLAATLGLMVSRAALVPVRRLIGATERVTRTQDLTHRIPDPGGDELGRLARSFNEMLAALERSRLSQRQLISDASHELRTPLTSVQANLDALAMDAALSPDERARAVAAAQAQLRELGTLVGDLVDLSKTEVAEIEVEDVRLDIAAAGAIERARLHAPESTIDLDAQPCIVRAAPARLDRAISNLLDNAIKWSPPGGPVEVHVRDGCIEVRDHGPGIDAEDLPRVFDRFYRAPAARSRPGAGLGLAIVRQLSETHGGSVAAANDPGGGARLTLRLPALPMDASDLAGAESQEPPPIR